MRKSKDPVLIDDLCVICKNITCQPTYLTESSGNPDAAARQLHLSFKDILLRIKLHSEEEQAGEQDQYPFLSTCRPHQISSLLSRQKAVSSAFHDRMKVKGSANNINNGILGEILKLECGCYPVVIN